MCLRIPMINQTLDSIVDTIRNPATRWEGLVQLKEFKDTSQTDRFIYFCDDTFWLIRWAVIEKIGDLKLKKCIPKLFEKLRDPDPNVQKNVQKALQKCSKKNLSQIVEGLLSNYINVRVFCRKIIVNSIQNKQEEIQTIIFNSSWIIANQLLHILFVEKKERLEPFLINATKVRTVQKHAIMMLAIINSERAIAHLISLYKQPHLKRHIIQAISAMNPSVIFPKLIFYLSYDNAKKIIQEILVKSDKASLPYIIQSLHNDLFADDLLYCLKKITITVPMYVLLEKKVKKHPHLSASINLDQLKPK